jgi:predicted nucleic acid-binding Zn ribbon protein
MSSKKGITPIGDILKTVFAKIESEKTFTREDIEEQWKAVVGAPAAKHTRPASLRKGVLTVFVDSSGWMQEMTLQKRKTLKQLKRTFGKDRISGIHFRIGEI